MRERTNCPNCGAPITQARCEYCGTMFFDFSNLEIGKPMYLRAKIGNNLNIFRAMPMNYEIEMRNDNACFYADEKKVYLAAPPSYTMRLELEVLPDDTGVLIERWSNEQQTKR